MRDDEFSMILASKLYEDEILSSGQAAKMAGLTKRTFIELLGKQKVSVFNNSIKELEEDI
jgi:predicted HTH domain antitoxin